MICVMKAWLNALSQLLRVRVYIMSRATCAVSAQESSRRISASDAVSSRTLAFPLAVIAGASASGCCAHPGRIKINISGFLQLLLASCIKFMSSSLKQAMLQRIRTCREFDLVLKILGLWEKMREGTTLGTHTGVPKVLSILRQASKRARAILFGASWTTRSAKPLSPIDSSNDFFFL